MSEISLLEALAVWGVKKGIIYVDDRVGLDGKLFSLYKFETVPKYLENLQGEPTSFYDTVEDSEIYKELAWYFKLLRKTRLDEIPQLLINIPKGDLALIGPRALIPGNEINLPEPLREARKKFIPGCMSVWLSTDLPLTPEVHLNCDYAFMVFAIMECRKEEKCRELIQEAIDYPFPTRNYGKIFKDGDYIELLREPTYKDWLKLENYHVTRRLFFNKVLKRAFKQAYHKFI